MPLRTFPFLAVLLAITVGLGGCGEPYRAEAMTYVEAGENAIKRFRSQSKVSNSLDGQLLWNDCGAEVTCLFLYQTKDQALVEAVAVGLMNAHAKMQKPGVKLTVYSSARGEPKVLFREITIK